MSTQLESWKYFAQEDVQSDDSGELSLGTLPGSADIQPTFSMPLMFLQIIMGGFGFLGVINALWTLKGVFDSGVFVEAMKKMQPHGLDAAGLAMAQSHQQFMFLIITMVIIKIFISCGFMGAALMLEKRVDHANWFAAVICLGAIIYNLVDFGLQYMMLPDFTKHGISTKESDIIMAGILIAMSAVLLFKMIVYLGLILYLNNKTNKAIFTPKERVACA